MAASNMTIKDYLKLVYPLAVSDIDTAPKTKLRDFFNSLGFYYQLNPQAKDLIPDGAISKRNQEILPKVDQLYWPSIINPEGFWCRNFYDPNEPLKNPFVDGFPSYSEVEIAHSNVYGGNLGVYYYFAKGSGIFVNIGKTLVARNKLDALRKLGYSNKDIANALNTENTAYWPQYNGGTLPPPEEKRYFRNLVDDYVKQHGVTVEQAQDAIINAAIDETDYHYGRVNDTGWQVDVDNFNLARQAGYDTVQLTTQANMNNAWAFEIIDLRIVDGGDIQYTMSHLRQFYTSRNPFNLQYHAPVVNSWPYYNLYSENTMSAIAKNYPSDEGRFPFPGPGSIIISVIPGNPRQ